MAFNRQLLDLLACPVSKGKLKYNEKDNQLISVSERLAYPIKDDIPALLESEAIPLTLEQIEALGLK